MTAQELTFAMIDLAGFTALTETHGDEHAANTAIRFADLARDSLSPDDQLVKCIGDAVLLASQSPSTGLALVQRILDRCQEIEQFLITRTGLHHGSAIRRGGDYFGAAVNLTARIAAHAAGGQVLGTAAVAEAARMAGIEATGLGRANFKNVDEPVELYELTLGASAVESIDPVCRMRVDHAMASGHLRVDGTDYWFCSLECASRFLRGNVAQP